MCSGTKEEAPELLQIPFSSVLGSSQKSTHSGQVSVRPSTRATWCLWLLRAFPVSSMVAPRLFWTMSKERSRPRRKFQLLESSEQGWPEFVSFVRTWHTLAQQRFMFKQLMMETALVGRVLRDGAASHLVHAFSDPVGELDKRCWASWFLIIHGVTNLVHFPTVSLFHSQFVAPLFLLAFSGKSSLPATGMGDVDVMQFQYVQSGLQYTDGHLDRHHSTSLRKPLISFLRAAGLQSPPNPFGTDNPSAEKKSRWPSIRAQLTCDVTREQGNRVAIFSCQTSKPW